MKKILVVAGMTGLLAACNGTIPPSQYGAFKDNPLTPAQRNVPVGAIFDPNTRLPIGSNCVVGVASQTAVTDSSLLSTIQTDFNAKASIATYVSFDAGYQSTDKVNATYSDVSMVNLLDRKLYTSTDTTDPSNCSQWLEKLVGGDTAEINYFAALLKAGKLVVSTEESGKAGGSVQPGKTLADVVKVADASLSIQRQSDNAVSISGADMNFAFIPGKVRAQLDPVQMVTCRQGNWCKFAGPSIFNLRPLDLLLIDRSVGVTKWQDKAVVMNAVYGVVSSNTDTRELDERRIGFLYWGNQFLRYQVDSIDFASHTVNLAVTTGKLVVE